MYKMRINIVCIKIVCSRLKIMETINIQEKKDEIQKIKDRFARKVVSRIGAVLMGELVKLREEEKEKETNYYQRRFFY